MVDSLVNDQHARHGKAAIQQDGRTGHENWQMCVHSRPVIPYSGSTSPGSGVLPLCGRIARHRPVALPYLHVPAPHPNKLARHGS